MAQSAGIVAIAVMTILVLAFGLGGSVLLTVGIHLSAFFATALMYHSEMVRRRPAPSGLTTFYFCMSIGGALGGVFNALVAPALFSSDIEYYLALVAACLLRGLVKGDLRAYRIGDSLYPLLLGLVVAVVVWRFADATPFALAGRLLVLLPCALALYWFSERSLRFALGIAMVMGGALFVRSSVDVLHVDRSFFGINKVKLLEQGKKIALVHGTTLHGTQFTDPARRREPLSYYARSGPAGQMFARGGGHPRAALIGLASGGFFGIAAISVRGGSLSLGGDGFLVQAAFTLAVMLVFQTVMMGTYMAIRNASELREVLAAWRVAMWVGASGAIASIGWFTAMTIQNAALVRALGQIELVFTIAASVIVFREKIVRMELVGILLVVAGIVILLLR